MSRHGFALLTVLWVVTILGLLVGGSLQRAQVGAATSRNRIALTRGAWAREACLEILLSRYAGNSAVRSVDTVDLGRGTWCRAELEDAGARLDLNLATPAALRMVVGNDSLADALLDWRDADDVPRPLGAESGWYKGLGQRPPRNGPYADVAELRLVRGFGDSVAVRLAPLLTTRGTGRLNLNSAQPSLIATLPGIGPEAVSVLAQRRLLGEKIQSMDQLAALLSPVARKDLAAHYEELNRLSATEPTKFIGVLEGGVRGAHSVARAVLTLVPAGRRLAVTRREVQ